MVGRGRGTGRGEIGRGGSGVVVLGLGVEFARAVEGGRVADLSAPQKITAHQKHLVHASDASLA